MQVRARRLRRRRLQPIVAVAVLAIVAGCTPATPTTGPGAASPGAPTAQVPTEPVTLHLMRLASSVDDFWNETIRQFQEKYPNITINAEVVPGSDFDAKWNAYIQSRSGPDVITMQAGVIWQSFKDALQPLNELRDETANFHGSDGFCEDFDCSKNVYAIPYNMQGYVLWYNKAVLTEVGLDPENPPQTWREMDAACQKLVAADKICWALGVKRSGPPLVFSEFVQETMSLDEQKGFASGATKWTDPGPLNAVRLYAWAVEHGWFNSDAPALAHIGDAEGLFTSGKAAFIPGFVAEIMNWKVFGAALGDENIGAVTFPTIEQDYPLAGVGPGPLSGTAAIAAATAMGVPIWSEKKDAALTWIRFLAEKANQERYFELSQPARKDLTAPTSGGPAFLQLQDIIGESSGNLIRFNFGFVGDPTIVAQFTEIFLGQTTPEAAVEVIQAAYE